MVIARKKGAWTIIALAWVVAMIFFPAPAASQPLTVEEILAALGKGPALGRNDAPVTIIEFSDFQCSFCKRFWSNTLPKIKESYINQGRVRFVYRHFAILGKFSQQAAMASECAAEQGKFWEYHDKLFTSQGWSALSDSKLKQYARELKLDPQDFDRCVDSNKYKKKVEGETAMAASLGARGTPAFFVNRRFLAGAQPFEVFRRVIESELKKKSGKH